MKVRYFATYLACFSVFASCLGAPLSMAASSRGEYYRVRQLADKQGRLRSETIVGRDYVEFLLRDPLTKKTLEWSVERPSRGVSFHAKDPDPNSPDGRFSTFEIEQKRPGGKLVLTYLYLATVKSYKLLSAKFHVNHIEHADEITYGLTCDDGSPQFKAAETWEAILAKMNATDHGQEATALNCYLNHYQSAFFAPNCMQSFGSSLDNLKKGIVDVITSQGKPGTPKYLQCLDQQGFAAQTAKIESYFNSVSMDLMQAIRGSAKPGAPVMTSNASAPGFAAQLATALGNPNSAARDSAVQKLCSLDNQRQPPIDPTVQFVTGHPAVTCDAPASSTEVAQFDPQTKQIYIMKPGLSEQQYASAFFHEALHESGIESETLTYALEYCCNEQTMSDKDANCAKAKKIASATDLTDRYNTGLTKEFDGFDQLSTEMNVQLGTKPGTENNGENLMKSYLTGFDAHAQTAENIDNSCLRGGQSLASASGQTLENYCAQLYLNDMAKFTRDFFNDSRYCEHYEILAGHPNPSQCAAWGQQISNLILSGHPLNAARGGAASIMTALMTTKADPKFGFAHEWSQILAPAGGDSVAEVGANKPLSNSPTQVPGQTIFQASGGGGPAPVDLGVPSAQRADQIQGRVNVGERTISAASKVADLVSQAVLPSAANAAVTSNRMASAGVSSEQGENNSPTVIPTSRLPDVGFINPVAPVLGGNAGGSLLNPATNPAISPSSGSNGNLILGGGNSNAPGSSKIAGGSGGGATGANGEPAAQFIASRNASEQEADAAGGGRRAVNSDRENKSGLRQPAAIAPPVDRKKPTNQTAQANQTKVSQYSDGRFLRSFILGEYAKVKKAILRDKSNFVRGLIDNDMQITDDIGVMYPATGGQDRYRYCGGAIRRLLPSRDPAFLTGACP